MVEDGDLLPAREELGRMITKVMTISNQDDEGNGDLFPARRKLDMTKKNKVTDMMRMIRLSIMTNMIITNLLPAGEKLRPDQLGVELLLRRLEGACLVRRMVNISWMISWSRVLIISVMNMMTSLVGIISETRVLIIFLMNMMTSLARMISWTIVLIIFCMTIMASLTRMISWTQMLTLWSSIRKSRLT